MWTSTACYRIGIACILLYIPRGTRWTDSPRPVAPDSGRKVGNIWASNCEILAGLTRLSCWALWRTAPKNSVDNCNSSTRAHQGQIWTCKFCNKKYRKAYICVHSSHEGRRAYRAAPSIWRAWNLINCQANVFITKLETYAIGENRNSWRLHVSVFRARHSVSPNFSISSKLIHHFLLCLICLRLLLLTGNFPRLSEIWLLPLQ